MFLCCNTVLRVFTPHCEKNSGFDAFPLNVWEAVHAPRWSKSGHGFHLITDLHYSLAYLAMKSSSKLQWDLPSVWFPCRSGQSSFMICFHAYDRIFIKTANASALKTGGMLAYFFYFQYWKKISLWSFHLLILPPRSHQNKHLLK